jgi:hypothetical protein
MLQNANLPAALIKLILQLRHCRYELGLLRRTTLGRWAERTLLRRHSNNIKIMHVIELLPLALNFIDFSLL